MRCNKDRALGFALLVIVLFLVFSLVQESRDKGILASQRHQEARVDKAGARFGFYLGGGSHRHRHGHRDGYYYDPYTDSYRYYDDPYRYRRRHRGEGDLYWRFGW